MKKTAKKTQAKKNTRENPLFLSSNGEGGGYLAVDLRNIPLATMPRATIQEQRLFHRRTFVALVSKDNRLVLCHHISPTAHECWHMLSDGVRANEGCEDTAIRLIQTIITPPEELHPLCTNKYHAYDNSFRTLFLARLPKQFQTFTHLAPEAFWLMDEDEFTGLTADTPDVFSPEVLWAAPFLEGIFKKQPTVKGSR